MAWYNPIEFMCGVFCETWSSMNLDGEYAVNVIMEYTCSCCSKYIMQLCYRESNTVQ